MIECNTTGNNGVPCHALFDEAVLPRREAEIMLQRYESALARVTAADADHQLQISHFTSATPSDLQQIMAWNRQLPGDSEVVEDYIHHVIARQAVAQPDGAAVYAYDRDSS